MNIKIEKVPVFDFFTEVEKKYLDIKFADFCAENKIKKPKEVLIEAYALGIACGVGVFLSRFKEGK